MNTLDAALWLAGRNFHVFRADHPGRDRCAGVGRAHDAESCADRGKHPAVAFTRTHTADPEQVKRWFSDQLWNVGVAVGACRGPAGEHLLVVDSDRPGAIEDAAASFGYAHTLTMRTITSKGYHDYYWAPASMRLGNGLGALRGRFDGDVRAGNAYVIGPGSVHATGVIYEVFDPEQPPVQAPPWLLEALTARPVTPQVRRTADRSVARRGGRLTGLIRFVLDSPAGERNSRLYWAARRAFEQESAADSSVASALLDAATHIGLPESEARQTITSAYRSKVAQ